MIARFSDECARQRKLPNQQFHLVLRSCSCQGTRPGQHGGQLLKVGLHQRTEDRPGKGYAILPPEVLEKAVAKAATVR